MYDPPAARAVAPVTYAEPVTIFQYEVLAVRDTKVFRLINFNPRYTFPAPSKVRSPRGDNKLLGLNDFYPRDLPFPRFLS